MDREQHEVAHARGSCRVDQAHVAVAIDRMCPERIAAPEAAHRRDHGPHARHRDIERARVADIAGHDLHVVTGGHVRDGVSREHPHAKIARHELGDE